MFGRFGYHFVGKLHQGDDDVEAQFQRHFRFQQASHHLKRQFQGVGWHVVFGVKPEVVHQDLAKFLGHEGMVRERVMVFGDAFRSPFVDAEVVFAQRDKRLMLFGNKNVLVSCLRQIRLQRL